MDENLRSQPDGADSNLVNMLSFVCKNIIKGTVSTAIPVRVDKVESSGDGAGYVSATPLVTSRDAKGNSVGAVSIPRLPFFRLYAGRASIVCDPVVGDIGLAIFAQQDSSLVNRETKEPKVAGSFRYFDMSDGFYIGGFYRGKVDTSISFDQSGNIVIDAPTACTINTKDANVNTERATVTASESIYFDSPSSRFTGDVVVDGFVQAKQDVSVNGLSLLTHTHTGVQRGDGRTDAPS